ncbi:MAG: hypothetical protein COV67_07110 [Nitrospinae bacterium CG11_big_fil_rev_8_21_14_0_20_56_8]|nr:MAG: hypothetical protein COV67_07110 [Nitrospinae bacterium CG11_big_fil_rev_8_21_14_0_20_56_8]
MPPLITLTTDFGLADPFAGIMKGVILRIAPSATIVDLTHEIQPQNIMQAAQVLGAAHPYFPPATIHVVVVDPGVGSARRPIVVKSRAGLFVGPDNGVLTPGIRAGCKIYEINRGRYFLPSPSTTFHGRDMFAPVAAWLARRTPPGRMGRRITDPATLAMPEARLTNGAITGQIIYIDRFGNLMTNISADFLKKTFADWKQLKVKATAKYTLSLVDHYAAVGPGHLGALINSWDRLEIFSRGGCAAKQLRLGIDSPVVVKGST